MRTLLVTPGVVAVVLIVLGLLLKSFKWLLILGVMALIVAIVLGVVKGRRGLR
ncbi:hypothetical protein Acy02nite_81840 [Actinoplanes cyaneus]|uniref:Uncharacterized protein n=1 Tax=Actinoplanes cyaneus TaxID=52696 RepID=A0A919IV67_9ACTN|nr:hypothetical protein [Actinoplanes cyaneus]MCW2143451.1 hypothetical protein [Actinoplanes cyaneus]GID70303.1 hypothetical protein Acy02nite_81840 [Actinoplanes cyaneus]